MKFNPLLEGEGSIQKLNSVGKMISFSTQKDWMVIIEQLPKINLMEKKMLKAFIV